MRRDADEGREEGADVGEASRRRRIAFVSPRYGEGVVGGAEAVVREAARGFARRGYEVEVLTTTAVDHYSWADELPAGESVEDGVLVRRFRTRQGHDLARWAALQHRVAAGERLGRREELEWANGRFQVPDLYYFLAEHAADYAAVVFAPYLFWSTLYCAPLAGERAVLMPCLHDEPYAYLRIVYELLAGAGAVWFLSEPEHLLGHRLAPLPPRHAVVGAAVEVPARYDPDGFRERHGLERPFVLYAGRREDGKGWGALVRAFAAAVVRHRLPFDLVTMGVGEVLVGGPLAHRVVDLGYVPSAEAPDAFAAAEALVQPSANESFSRTVMEAWLAGTPVVANAGSEVVSWHCERSGGGLTYEDDVELGECLAFVAEAPKLARALARRGRSYVLEHYTWPAVLDRMERSLEEMG
jgi:glycosyltransferase involved in cell wall biosynthesis